MTRISHSYRMYFTLLFVFNVFVLFVKIRAPTKSKLGESGWIINESIKMLWLHEIYRAHMVILYGKPLKIHTIHTNAQK